MRYLFSLTLCLLLVAVGAAEEPAWHRYTGTRPQMGATVTIVAYAQDAKIANAAIERGFERIEKLNAIFSDYEPNSECSRLNSAALTTQPVSLSEEMAGLLKESMRIARESDGAFDVSVGPLSLLWRRARKDKRLPTEESLKAAVAATGFELLEFDAEKGSLRPFPGMRLDFGGIAKGYIANAALAAVREAGCDSAMVNAGGDIALGDAPPNKSGWRIGVAPLKPRDPPSQVLEIANCGVATSGDAWQFLSIDGKRFSHIIDPRTGWAVERRSGVTVLAPNCTMADGLASAVSVLGPEKGIELVERFPGAAALVVEVRGDRVVSRRSDRFLRK